MHHGSSEDLLGTGLDDFVGFMDFVEGLVGCSFLEMLKEQPLLRNVILEMLREAAAAPEWGDNVALPGYALERTQRLLALLADIIGGARPSGLEGCTADDPNAAAAAATANFLAGLPCAPPPPPFSPPVGALQVT